MAFRNLELKSTTELKEKQNRANNKNFKGCVGSNNPFQYAIKIKINGINTMATFPSPEILFMKDCIRPKSIESF